jgi:hypothetical protein
MDIFSLWLQKVLLFIESFAWWQKVLFYGWLFAKLGFTFFTIRWLYRKFKGKKKEFNPLGKN